MLYPNVQIAEVIIKQLLLSVRPGKNPSQKPGKEKPKKQITKKNKLEQIWQIWKVKLSPRQLR